MHCFSSIRLTTRIKICSVEVMYDTWVFSQREKEKREDKRGYKRGYNELDYKCKFCELWFEVFPFFFYHFFFFFSTCLSEHYKET